MHNQKCLISYCYSLKSYLEFTNPNVQKCNVWINDVVTLVQYCIILIYKQPLKFPTTRFKQRIWKDPDSISGSHYPCLHLFFSSLCKTKIIHVMHNVKCDGRNVHLIKQLSSEAKTAPTEI